MELQPNSINSLIISTNMPCATTLTLTPCYFTSRLLFQSWATQKRKKLLPLLQSLLLEPKKDALTEAIAHNITEVEDVDQINELLEGSNVEATLTTSSKVTRTSTVTAPSKPSDSIVFSYRYREKLKQQRCLCVLFVKF